MNDLTELEDARLFKLEPLPLRTYEKDKIAWMDVTIEMNLDLRVVARDGYKIVDFLSDIGGM